MLLDCKKSSGYIPRKYVDFFFCCQSFYNQVILQSIVELRHLLSIVIDFKIIMYKIHELLLIYIFFN